MLWGCLACFHNLCSPVLGTVHLHSQENASQYPRQLSEALHLVPEVPLVGLS